MENVIKGQIFTNQKSMLNAAVHLLAKVHCKSISISPSEAPISVYLTNTVYVSIQVTPFKTAIVYKNLIIKKKKKMIPKT